MEIALVAGNGEVQTRQTRFDIEEDADDRVLYVITNYPEKKTGSLWCEVV